MSVENLQDMNFETGDNEAEKRIVFHPSMFNVNISMLIRTNYLWSMFPSRNNISTRTARSGNQEKATTPRRMVPARLGCPHPG